jgi:S1-C subfamily serine protease
MRSTLRLAGMVVLVGLAAYWAGARWGPREPVSVEALPQSKPQPARNAALGPGEAENVRIYQQAAPSVANIITRTVQYDFFFNPVAIEGAGSGFLIDDQGHILTNYHVVQQAREIEVILGDQKRYAAKFLGGDPRNDIALLRVEARGAKLTPPPLGDSSSLQVGQHVLAIGNPFGFQSTLTTGVVSALGRTVQTGDNTFLDEAIQTDAAINRGNSGGPLLNSRGEVIGVNTAIFSPTGTAAGIGFAIPINLAKRIANDILTHGRVRAAYLGIVGRPVWPQLAEALELPIQEGFLVERVAAGGPADRAGVRGGNRVVQLGLSQLIIGGDVLVALDGQKITTQLAMNLFLNRKRPGDMVTVTLYRGSQKMDVRVTLGERES